MIEANDIFAGSTALESSGSAPVFRHNTVRDNWAMGAVISLIASPAQIVGNRIVNNRGDFCGGIRCWQSNAEIRNNLICANHAWMGAGAISVESSTPQIVSNTIAGNHADDDWENYSAGAIWCSGSSPDIRNCILWGNTRGYGTPQPNQLTVSSGTPASSARPAAHSMLATLYRPARRTRNARRRPSGAASVNALPSGVTVRSSARRSAACVNPQVRRRSGSVAR